MKVLFLALFCCCVGAAVCQQDAAPAKPVALDAPALFKERGCAQCHQIRGVGGVKGPDLSGVGRRLKQSMIEHQIVAGGGAMPAFGDALAPAEVTALVKYLHRCRDKHGKPLVVLKGTPSPEVPS